MDQGIADSQLNEKIIAALADNSDFSFEMSVLHQLTEDLRFHCEHSGTYIDPIKQRNREFDIRAIKIFDASTRLHMAVECKNISASPLIVHRVPRRFHEAFHFVLRKNENPTSRFSQDDGPTCTPTYSVKMDGPGTPYQAISEVGKAMDQAVKDSKGNLKLSDGEVYDKMTQALNSLGEMVESIPPEQQANGFHGFLAILVVPEGALWAKDYSEKGVPIGTPKPADHIQYYVDRHYPFESLPTQGEFILSHMEIVTPKGLGLMLETYCKHFVNNAPLFPQDRTKFNS